MNHVTHISKSITLPDFMFDIFIYNRKETMKEHEIEKGKSHILINLIEYVPNSVVFKTIMQKTTGKISLVAIDKGEILAEKISPFDTFIQIIDGKADIIIDEEPNLLDTGEAIIIPAHLSHLVIANVRFKMISTIIKSGYNEAIL